MHFTQQGYANSSAPATTNMPHLDASALEQDVDGVALLSAALGIPMPEPVPEVAPVSGIVTSRRVLQVLVVESDRLLRESISIQLHLRGHVVLEADTSERAVATIRGGQTVDVLLTEIETSAGPDGWALAEEARRRHPSVVVIYTSAQPRELACPASGSISVAKPYRTEQILEAIRQLTQGPHRVADDQCETSTDVSPSEELLEAA
jgi:CheY-like chemotaxis protein